MKRLMLMATAALGMPLALGLAAPSAAHAQGNARIVVIVKATTSQFWATVFDGADAAAKVLGVQVSKLGAQAETDVAGEVSVTENAIASKPTAIVIAATNAQALGATDCQCDCRRYSGYRDRFERQH